MKSAGRKSNAADIKSARFLNTDQMTDRQEITILVGLFLLFRLMMPFWFTPIYSEFSHFLYRFLLLSEPGFVGPNVEPALPFIDYWLEYPPVFPWIAWLVFRAQMLFAGLNNHSLPLFNALMTLLMGIADTVNLWLIYRLAKEIRGHRFAMTASWAYGLLFFPLVLSFSYFDGLVLMLMLIALWAMIKQRPLVSGLILGLGFMTKMIPVALLACGAKYVGKKLNEEPNLPHTSSLDLRNRILSYFHPKLTKRDFNKVIAFFFGFFLIAAVIATPFALINVDYFSAPFRLITRRPPWETLQAVVAGQKSFGHIGPDEAYLNANPGYFQDLTSPHVPVIRQKFSALPRIQQAQVASRFSTNMDYLEKIGNPLQLPFTVAASFLMFTFFVWFPRKPSALNMTAITGLTLSLMFAWSSGWSPQFIIYILPFVLIVLPANANIVMAIIMSAVNFLELPLWLLAHLQKHAWADPILYTVVTVRLLVLALAIGAFAWVVAKEAITSTVAEELAEITSG